MKKINENKPYGIVALREKKKVCSISQNLENALKNASLKYEVYYDDNKDGKKLDEFCKKCSAIFTIGGDGTILSVLRSSAKANIPTVGINAGRKGFLAEIEEHEIPYLVSKIKSNDYIIEDRIILSADIVDADNNIVDNNILAVNDFNVSRNGHARVIRLDVFINDQMAESFDADGVLIASPIGSTAYSLSAGGPIVLPGVNCILITPVCSHSLHTRPLVAPDDVRISIHASDLLDDVIVTIDGQSLLPVPMKGRVDITKADFSARFIRIENDNYYNRFREKIISWSIK